MAQATTNATTIVGVLSQIGTNPISANSAKPDSTVSKAPKSDAPSENQNVTVNNHPNGTQMTQYIPQQTQIIYIVQTAPQPNTNPSITFPHNNIPVISNNYIPQNIIESSTKAMDKETDDDNALIQRKLWDKEHIIWMIAFGIGIYDYITDIQLCLKWFQLPHLCMQFKCEISSHDIALTSAILVFFGSTIGFIAALGIKFKEMMSLRSIYKQPMTKKQIMTKNLQYWRCSMYMGWMVVMIEDGWSLLWVIGTYSSVQYFVGLDAVYRRSIILSFLSILIQILNSLRKHNRMRKRNIYACARCCHCCWCTCICIWVSILFFSFVKTMTMISVKGTATSPLVGIKRDGMEPCYVYHQNDGWGQVNAGSTEFEGVLTKRPSFLYSNCSGSDYEYDVFCTPDTDPDVTILHCALELEYKYKIDNFTSEIDLNSVDLYEEFQCYGHEEEETKCLFDVELDVCDYMEISCLNEFNFPGTQPKMWACFQYCRA